jgi:hypothetical protein
MSGATGVFLMEGCIAAVFRRNRQLTAISRFMPEQRGVEDNNQSHGARAARSGLRAGDDVRLCGCIGL